VGKVDIGIPQGDEPLLTFSAVVRDQYGVDTAIDLTGATILWTSKATETTADASGVQIVGSIVNPATNGVFVVQITNAVTGTAGKFVYKVVVTKAGRPITVQHGDLRIADT